MINARYVWVRVFLWLVPCGAKVLQFSAVSMGTRDGSRTFVSMFVAIRISVRCFGGSARLASGVAVGRGGSLYVPVIRVPRGPPMDYLFKLRCSERRRHMADIGSRK